MNNSNTSQLNMLGFHGRPSWQVKRAQKLTRTATRRSYSLQECRRASGDTGTPDSNVGFPALSEESGLGTSHGEALAASPVLA
jgi:hypothetical protein